MSAAQVLQAVNALPRREHEAFLDALVRRKRKALLRRLEDGQDAVRARKVLASTKEKDWIPHEKVKARLGWK